MIVPFRSIMNVPFKSVGFSFSEISKPTSSARYTFYRYFTANLLISSRKFVSNLVLRTLSA